MTISEMLIWLAEKYEDEPTRPCCDAETTLEDWADFLRMDVTVNVRNG